MAATTLTTLTTVATPLTTQPSPEEITIITTTKPSTQEFPITSATPTTSSLHTRISLSPHTPFQKRVWLLCLQIPPGSVSTYNAIALHLKSSPRAVGNALKRNPFAPEVPCHRVVMTNATLGGFKGKIARRDGKDCVVLGEKRSILRREGIRFDEQGRVKGTVFGGFV